MGRDKHLWKRRLLRFGVGGAVGALASGVNVGGDKGKFNVVTKTYKDEQILVVPPMASVALSEDGYRDSPIKKREKIVTGSYEFFNIPNLSLKRDQIVKYTEENTPKTINYMITYSFDKELNNCSVINFGVYLKDAFGATKLRDWATHFILYERAFKTISPKTIIVH